MFIGQRQRLRGDATEWAGPTWISTLDGGATFGASVKANDDPTCATHFAPAIAVDAKGRVHVAFTDNRYWTGHVFWTLSPTADANHALCFGKNVPVDDRGLYGPLLAGHGSYRDWLPSSISLSGTDVFISWDPLGYWDFVSPVPAFPIAHGVVP